jgi:hypothetical protein
MNFGFAEDEAAYRRMEMASLTCDCPAMSRPLRRNNPCRRQGDADEIRPPQGAAPDCGAADDRASARERRGVGRGADRRRPRERREQLEPLVAERMAAAIVVQEPQLGTAHAVEQAEAR